MQFSIIVGHTKTQPGFVSPYLKQSEYDWNRDLADRIKIKSGNLKVKIFYRDVVGIAGAYKASDEWGAHASVELHFNASHNATSTGSGVLYLAGSSKGKAFAQHLQSQLKKVLSLPDWPKGCGGVVTPFQASGKQERGRTSLSAGKAAAALVEPFFGSNPSDCKAADLLKDDLAHAYCEAFRAYEKALN